MDAENLAPTSIRFPDRPVAIPTALSRSTPTVVNRTITLHTLTPVENTNDARRTHEINARIAMAKAASDKIETFHPHTGLTFKEETTKWQIMCTAFYGVETSAPERGSQTPAKF